MIVCNAPIDYVALASLAAAVLSLGLTVYIVLVQVQPIVKDFKRRAKLDEVIWEGQDILRQVNDQSTILPQAKAETQAWATRVQHELLPLFSKAHTDRFMSEVSNPYNDSDVAKYRVELQERINRLREWRGDVI